MFVNINNKFLKLSDFFLRSSFTALPHTWCLNNQISKQILEQGSYFLLKSIYDF